MRGFAGKWCSGLLVWMLILTMILTTPIQVWASEAVTAESEELQMQANDEQELGELLSAQNSSITLEQFLWPDADGKYSCHYTEAEAGKEYLIFVVSGIYESRDQITADVLVSQKKLIYIDQKTADENGVVFSGFSPAKHANSTVVIGGGSQPEIVGYISRDIFNAGDYYLDPQGNERLEDSFLIRSLESEDPLAGILEQLPKQAYAEVYSTYMDPVYVPVSFDWSKVDLAGDAGKENLYRICPEMSVVEAGEALGSLVNLLTPYTVNIQVQNMDSLPVSLHASMPKIVYRVNEEFTQEDLTALSVKAVFDDGTVREITEWTSNAHDISTAVPGIYTLVISANVEGIELTAEIKLHVLEETAGEEMTGKCLVTFDTLGGSPVPSAYVEKGELLTIPDEPRKNGYIFSGWFCDIYREQEFDAESPVTSDMILYAGWVNAAEPMLKQIYVTLSSYMFMEGERLTEEQIKVYAVYEDGSEKEVDSFAHNLDQIDQSEAGTYTLRVKYSEKAISKETEIAFRLLREDKLQTYTVMYDTGCRTAIESQTIIEGEYLKAPDVSLENENYVFAGWYFGDTEWNFEKNPVKQDMTLTAKWAKQSLTVSEEMELVVYTEEIGVYEYTGKKITPVPVVMDNNLNVLQNKKDYTIKYTNNTLPTTEGTKAHIIITGKGNYTGTLDLTFDIKKKDLEDTENVTLTLGAYSAYNAKGYKPVPKVLDGKTVLKADRDFKVSYQKLDSADAESGRNVSIPLKESGYYAVIVEGIGNYTGIRSLKYQIGASGYKNLSSAKIAVDKAVQSVVYTGEPVNLDGKVKITLGKQVLTEGVDYRIVYPQNSADIGKITLKAVALQGSEFCFGEKTFTITVKGLAVNTVEVVQNQKTVNYNGSLQTDNVSLVRLKVSKSNKDILNQYYGLGLNIGNYFELEEGRDYTLQYKGSEKAGTATVVVTGKGLFEGSVKKTFQIAKIPLTSQNITCKILSNGLRQNKAGAIPGVVLYYNTNGQQMLLKEAVDYKLAFKNHTKAGIAQVTISGIGNYSGKLTKSYVISKKTLASDDISIVVTNPKLASKKDNFVYKPKLQVFDNGKVLKEKSDYIVDYSTCLTHGDIKDGNNSGVIMITAVEKGSYIGRIAVRYKVAGNDISAKTCTIKIANQEYCGKAITFDLSDESDRSQFEAYVKDAQGNLTVLKPGVDFEIISYSKNISYGKATVTIRGIGEYTGTQKATFNIVKRKLSH